MRELPARLPPIALERKGGPWREAFFFLVAFGVMFGAAMLGLEMLAGIVG